LCDRGIVRGNRFWGEPDWATSQKFGATACGRSDGTGGFAAIASITSIAAIAGWGG
jgi:hypothetical protein